MLTTLFCSGLYPPGLYWAYYTLFIKGKGTNIKLGNKQI